MRYALPCSALTLAALSLAPPADARPWTSGDRAVCAQVDPLFGDLNGDCIVNTEDFLIAAVGDAAVADLDGDGAFGTVDLQLLAANMGYTCGWRLLGDVNGSGEVDTQDLLTIALMVGADLRGDVNRDGIVDEVDVNMVAARQGATMGQRLAGDVTGDAQITIRDTLNTLNDDGLEGCASETNADGVSNAVETEIVSARLGHIAGVGPLPGDLNADAAVDAYDLALMVAAQQSAWPPADLDGDGDVNTSDLLLLTGPFWTIAGATLWGDVDGDGVVDGVDERLLTLNMGGAWNQADLNRDGVVNTRDLLLLLSGYDSRWGEQLPGDVDGSCRVDASDQALVAAPAAGGGTWTLADIDGAEGDPAGLVDGWDEDAVDDNLGLTCP